MVGRPSFNGTLILLVLAFGLAGGWACVGALAEAEEPAQADKPPLPESKEKAEGGAKKSSLNDQYGDPLPEGAVARLGARRFRHEGAAEILVFSPDGKTLIGFTNSGALIWDAANGKELLRMHVGKEVMNACGMDISPDGMILAISDQLPSKKTIVGLFDLKTGKKTRTLALPDGDGFFANEYVRHICFARDGKSLALINNTGNIVIFDLLKGLVRASLGGRKNSPYFYNLAFSPDSRLLATAGYSEEPNAADHNHAVQIWDSVTGKLTRVIQELPPFGGKSYVSAIAFSPTAKTLAIGSRDRIFLFDPATGKDLGQLETKMRPIGLAFTPDGNKLVLCGEGNFSGERSCKILIWDAITKKLLIDTNVPSSQSMALSPDGKTVALGAWGTTVRLWDVASGKEQFTDYKGHHFSVINLAFSPDGKTLASAEELGQIFLWKTADWERIAILPRSGGTLSFAPDGKSLASLAINKNYSFGGMRIWDVATCKEALAITFPDNTDIQSVTFSPDGRKLFTFDKTFIAAGTSKYRVIHWDLATGKQDRLWNIPPQQYWQPSLSRDGKTVYVSMTDSWTSALSRLNIRVRGANTHRIWPFI